MVKVNRRPQIPITRLDKAEPIHPQAQGADYVCLHLLPMMTRPKEKLRGQLGNWPYDRGKMGVFENVLLCGACQEKAEEFPLRVYEASGRKLVGRIPMTVADKSKLHPNAAFVDCHCKHVAKRLTKAKSKKPKVGWGRGKYLLTFKHPNGEPDYQVMLCGPCVKKHEMGFTMRLERSRAAAAAGI